jgi:hypothetical protein
MFGFLRGKDPERAARGQAAFDNFHRIVIAIHDAGPGIGGEFSKIGLRRFGDAVAKRGRRTDYFAVLLAAANVPATEIPRLAGSDRETFLELCGFAREYFERFQRSDKELGAIARVFKEYEFIVLGAVVAGRSVPFQELAESISSHIFQWYFEEYQALGELQRTQCRNFITTLVKTTWQ